MSMYANEHKKMSINITIEREKKELYLEIGGVCEYDTAIITAIYYLNGKAYRESVDVEVSELREVLDKLTKVVEELEEAYEHKED